ncbi:hypothetical protein BgAZ_305900 [Babesia gibsoni]|uniref:Cap-specific mRNA (nucleoside-2'-O-)-methyltransferase 2 n=1 Tax=Babesia gibsoni TaxID=33632 RepID=A0AAD8PE25_BABGI|nr:hypothetical protein BgAZ_305900 [Babesia gibsoni]
MATNNAEDQALLHNEKRFVFQGNLNRLLLDPKHVPPSSQSCAKCIQRKRVCICSTINGSVGRAPTYEVVELAETKLLLSQLKDSLNDIDINKWSVHTKLLDHTSLVVKHLSELNTNVNGHLEPGVELATNAWLKLYEILEVYKVVETLKPNIATERGEFRSFHLSECPGGFIAALNHTLKCKNSLCEHSWMATSLNPYHEANNHNECLAEDILFRETPSHWLNGADESGNIMSASIIEYIWDRVSRPSRYNKNKEPVLFDLVTADGSVNCQSDPNNQESMTAALKLSEMVCALGLMRVGSIFIIKMFTFFEESSLSMIALLSMCFKSVEVYKPHLSKASSSEVYVICIGFNGITSVLLCALCKFVNEYVHGKKNNAILPKEWIPSSFRAEVVECAKMFAQLQCRNMRNTMSQYMQIADESVLYKKKRVFATKFLNKFNIKAIPSDCRLVKYMSYSDSVITGKSTSSLFHIPKRHIPNLDARRVYVKQYRELQERRKELYKQYKTKKEPSHFLNISEECTPAEFGKNIKGMIDFSREYRPDYPELNMDRLSFDLDDRLLSDLRSDLKNQRYLKESWFVAAPLHAHEIRMSHFVCNDILYDVTCLRTYCGDKLPVVTPQDILWVEGGVGEALSDFNLLPNPGMVDLALVFKEFLKMDKYKSFLEITTNASQQFPAVSLLKRHGISGSLICGFKSSSEGGSLIHFDSFYDLQVIVNSFVGDGSLTHCLEFNYDEHLSKSSGYKALTTQLVESPLRSSCDFVFCDSRRYPAHHREPCFYELKTKHILVAQLVQALNCISPTGDIVIATSTIITRFTVCIIIVLRAVFDEVHLYHPPSAAPWTQRSYIICKRYNDKDNSLCRHFLQCLWDAICLHKKGGKEVVQSLLPVHFTQYARKLWDVNTKFLLEEFEDIALHESGEVLKSSREEHAVNLLQRLGVINILFPTRLVESSDPCRLPIFGNVEIVDKPQKRKLEELDTLVVTPPESPSIEEDGSPIWSSEES